MIDPPGTTNSSQETVIESLRLAQRRGFLGPGPVTPHVSHARGFAWPMAEALGRTPEHLADLGAGAGVPGLVLALDWGNTKVVLIEGALRRAEHLRAAVDASGMSQRVEVELARAEEVGRNPRHRGTFDGVVARSFGRPGVTAECAAPLLRVGGVLVVSEPPSPSESTDRWPEEPLQGLGMRLESIVEVPVRVVVLRQVELCSDRFPRRVGVPSKRPLF